MTVRVEGEIVIRRPVEEVFDFVADQRNEPKYNPQMLRAEKITDGPIGVGTRFVAETLSRGKPVEMVIEVTQYERPHRLSSSTHMEPMDLHGTLTFDPVAAGTWMRWSWELAPRGVLKLIGPVIGQMGRNQEKKIWSGLKHHLEADSTNPT